MNLLSLVAAAAAAAGVQQGETKEIAPGVLMPVVNAGHPDDGTQEAAQAALWFAQGGAGIDTAFDYHNQDQVGQAIRQSGVNRTKIFVTTKISPKECSKASALQAVQEDLKELNLPFVDLVLHHFPCRRTSENKAVWEGLEEAHLQGLARSIGISNYKKEDIDSILAGGGTKVLPAVNQCQMSIGSHDDETIAYSKQHNITYEAFSPLRRVDLSNEKITSIANKHSVSTAQIALRWITQQDILIATSPGTNKQYVKEDLDLFSFTLSQAEMAALSAI